jgi:hypothetical protein
MQPEERFDAILENYRRGLPSTTPTSDEMERLATADRFAQLRELHFPEDFASRIENRVRQRARAMQSSTESANGSGPGIGATARFPWRRAVVAASVIAVLVLGGWGIVNASSHSIPGDPLYGLKQWQNQIALNQATNPTAKAQMQITQLDQAITDLSSEISGKRSAADINAALAIVIRDTQQAQTSVTHLNNKDQASAAASLQQVKDRERAILRGALLRVPFTSRVAFTTQLGSLGDTVLTITQITLTHETNAHVLLTINGHYFQSGASVVVDGTSYTPVSTTADAQLVIEIATNQWAGSDRSIGVQNPDGTAVLAANSLIPSDSDDGPNSAPAKGNGTPTPTPDNGIVNNGHHHPTPTPKPTKEPHH